MQVLTPKGLTTRPTLDKARQALFNMLQGELVDANVADIFAGSGAIGIEALSRGARAAAFVENDAECMKFLQKNLDEMQRRLTAMNAAKLPVALLNRNLTKAWPELAAKGPFDLVWADPPYDAAGRWWPLFAEQLPQMTVAGSIFAAESDEAGAELLTAEFSKLADWSLSKQKSYGRCWITLFRRSI
jgi:16S rRNA (guanine966-N2)-methyltransferase